MCKPVAIDPNLPVAKRKSARFLAERLLPLTRYFAYLETPDESGARMSSLWVIALIVLIMAA